MKVYYGFFSLSVFLNLSIPLRAELRPTLILPLNHDNEKLCKDVISSARFFISSYREAEKNSFNREDMEDELYLGLEKLREEYLNPNKDFPKKEEAPVDLGLPKKRKFRKTSSHLAKKTPPSKTQAQGKIPVEEEAPRLAVLDDKFKEMIQKTLKEYNPELVKSFEKYIHLKDELLCLIQEDIEDINDRIKSSADRDRLIDQVESLTETAQETLLTDEEIYLQAFAASALGEDLNDEDDFKAELYIRDVYSLESAVYGRLKLSRLKAYSANFIKLSDPYPLFGISMLLPKRLKQN